MRMHAILSRYSAANPPVQQLEGLLSADRGILNGPLVTLAYTSGVAMTPDWKLGATQVLTITDAVAFTLNAPSTVPTAAPDGALLTLTIRNTSGGALGAATFNAVFKQAAWVNPANGFSRSITWRKQGVNWVEISRTPADVPN